MARTIGSLSAIANHNVRQLEYVLKTYRPEGLLRTLLIECLEESQRGADLAARPLAPPVCSQCDSAYVDTIGDMCAACADADADDRLAHEHDHMPGKF